MPHGTQEDRNVERNWESELSRKLVTASGALDRLMPGDRIFVSTGCAEPSHLVDALAAHAPKIPDAEILHFVNLGSARLLKALGGRFRLSTFAVGRSASAMMEAGQGDYLPLYLSEVAHLMREGVVEVDVALIHVSPPDDHGYCSLGISVDLSRCAVETSGLVIAQVNPQMPRTLGDTFVHVEKVDFFVEGEAPLVTLAEPSWSERALAVARNTAALIKDGDTLELGFGRITAAIPQFLMGRKDLGAHTEWLGDGLMRLAKAGVLTGLRKVLHPGKIVATTVMGSQELYDFVHENPAVMLAPSEYVCNPRVFAKNKRMVAINQEQFVDLTGQISSDRTFEETREGRPRYHGRHLEFQVGAALSRGGRSVVCLPSTTETEPQRSRIMVRLPEGAGISTSRADVHSIVTEYGVAELRGRNMHERALALIQIAHPTFREKLLEEAKAAGLVYGDQLPVTKSGSFWPQEIQTMQRFNGGVGVAFRPVRATDVREIRALFYKLSDRSRYLRFFAPIRVLPRVRAQKMAYVNFADDMVIVGHTMDRGERLVAVGEYLKIPERNVAEVGFIVHEEYQGRGIGTFMIRFLAEVAVTNGIDTFVAEVLPDNRGMVQAFQQSGLPCSVHREPDLVTLSLSLVSLRADGAAGGVEPEE